MPFDFHRYDTKCATMTAHELQHEWEHYTRLIASAATSTSVSGMALPFTAGISGIGIALSAPAIHNARKKREIIDKHLARLGAEHDTRKRDVLAPMALSSTVGLLTMGIGHASSGAISNAAFEHGWVAVAAHEGAVKVTSDAALHGVAMAGEEEHMKKKKEKEALRKAGLISPGSSTLDLQKVNSVGAIDLHAIQPKSSGVQSAAAMGLKPSMPDAPAMGLSHSVPTTPMDPAPAYTQFAEAAQTGYFPSHSDEDEAMHVTDSSYKPPADASAIPTLSPILLPQSTEDEPDSKRDPAAPIPLVILMIVTALAICFDT